MPTDNPVRTDISAGHCVPWLIKIHMVKFKPPLVRQKVELWPVYKKHTVVTCSQQSVLVTCIMRIWNMFTLYWSRFPERCFMGSLIVSAAGTGEVRTPCVPVRTICQVPTSFKTSYFLFIHDLHHNTFSL